MVAGFVGTLKLALSFLPVPVQALILGAVALLVLIIAFRVIRMVLDAIPFL